MPLPQSIQKVITAYEKSGFPPYSSFEPSVLRTYFNNAFHNKPTLPFIEMDLIQEVFVKFGKGAVRTKIFYPLKTHKPMPVLIYFHGGGFVIRDDMLIYDHTCRLIASKTNAIVIAVDYSLAPENPFPYALNDCYHAVNYFYEHASNYELDKNNFNLIGESCGGNLVTSVSMMLRDQGGARVQLQIIISPMLGLDFKTDSYQECETGYILTTDTMKWFWSKYLSTKEDLQNPYAVPLMAKNLSNLPKALIVTTQYDVLRDDGRLYAELLTKSGNDVVYKCYDGLIHGFLDLYYKSPEAKNACNEVMDIVKNLITKECLE